MVIIAIVDDDPYIVEVFAVTFEHAGHSVLPFTDPQEALEKLPHLAPDIILLDLMMTPITGLQFLDEWRKLESLRDVPVIILSAWDVSSEDREKYASVIARVIRKPILPRALLETVRELCPG